jgi:hypothetical protein
LGHFGKQLCQGQTGGLGGGQSGQLLGMVVHFDDFVLMIEENERIAYFIESQFAGGEMGRLGGRAFASPKKDHYEEDK